MYNPNKAPLPANRKFRRELERFMKKNPDLSYTQAFNKLFHTQYDEPPFVGTECCIKDNEEEISK